MCVPNNTFKIHKVKIDRKLLQLETNTHFAVNNSTNEEIIKWGYRKPGKHYQSTLDWYLENFSPSDDSRIYILFKYIRNIHWDSSYIYIYIYYTYTYIYVCIFFFAMKQNSTKLKELKSYRVFSGSYIIQLEINNRKISGNSQVFGIEQHTSK